MANSDFEYSLTQSEQISLGFSALSDVYDIYNSLQTSKNEAANYKFRAFMGNFNANVIRQDAQQILDAAGREANIVREQGKREKGEQIADMSASGFNVASKSYQSMLTETDRNIEDNVAYIRENAVARYAAQMYQAKGMDIQADYERKAAKQVKKAAKKQALISGISAAAKLGFAAYFGEGGVENMGQTKTGQVPLPASHPWR